MKKKAHKFIMLVLFALILVLMPVMTFLTMPSDPKPFSENENRYLTVFPTFNADNYKDKTFMKDFEKWFADRFFGRETLIRTKNHTQSVLGKTDINGIFTGGGRMIEIWEGYDTDFVDKNLAAMDNFAAKYPNIPMYFLPAPTSQEIYSQLMPTGAPIGSQSEFTEHCREKLTNIQTINVVNVLKKNSDSYIYYRTDHHWTTLGAYYAYYEAAQTMGYRPAELSDFDIEHASDSFRGTLYSKTLNDLIEPDIMDYYHPVYGKAVKLTVNDGTEVKEYDSLYFREYLDVKDKYSSFLGPNTPYMDIKTNADGPSLLIFKDSYAHCFIPFLTGHYSRITVLDPRYIKTGYRNYADPDEYDSVLFLFNAITFSEQKEIRIINLG